MSYVPAHAPRAVSSQSYTHIGDTTHAACDGTGSATTSSWRSCRLDVLRRGNSRGQPLAAVSSAVFPPPLHSHAALSQPSQTHRRHAELIQPSCGLSVTLTDALVSAQLSMMSRPGSRSMPSFLSSSIVLLVCLLLCLIAPTHSSTASPLPSAPRPPARVVTPTFKPLHVTFSIVTATTTHMTAPLEIAKILVQRGHRISIVCMEYHEQWLGDEMNVTRQLGFRYIRSESDGRPVNEAYDEAIAAFMKKGVAGVEEVARVLFEPTYVPTMRTHQRLVAEDKPDVMMCDMLAYSCIDLADKLGIPYVVMFPGQMGDRGLGDGFDTPSQLTSYGQHWHEQPMWHRFVNTFLVLPYAMWNFGGIEARMNALRAQFDIAPNVGPLDKWMGHDILFNGHWAFDYAGYLPPYYHLIGPIQPTGKVDRSDASNIAPQLRHWLDESQQLGIPVVYMALGSISYLMESRQAAFIEAFATCPALPLSAAANHSSAAPRFRVVWQSNKPLAASTRAAMPEWVREEKWVAQPAVLAHPATALFITHMGSASLQQGLAVGLPLLGVPFFGDQPGNAVRLQDNGVAIKVDQQSVTAAEVCHAMRHLVYSPTVRAAVDRLQLVSHLAVDGARRGADVVERAAYVGTAHLLPYRERKDVSWLVRYNVDVYAVGACMLLLATYAVYRAAATATGAAAARLAGSGSKSKLA